MREDRSTWQAFGHQWECISTDGRLAIGNYFEAAVMAVRRLPGGAHEGPLLNVDPADVLEVHVRFRWLFLMFAVIPALRLLTLRRAKTRPGDGLCARCGYDLRATPERCPECGAVPAEALG
jgi:hypothetical protein